MIKFIEGSEKLSSREVCYWKKVFESNLLFATEVEFESDSSNFSISELRGNLDCSGSISYYGSGIEEVKSDGSLRNGAEILTPPRRIYSMLQMVSGYKGLVDKLYDYEPIIKSRAGWHNHVSLMCIGSTKAQEMKVPVVILKNLLSLLKIYYPALAYFTSTLPESEGALTRYDYFSRHQSLLSYNSTNNIRSIMSGFSSTRYQNINMNRLEVNENGIDRFHIEFRFPDCSLFPVQMACFNILIKALILKAIELSSYGIISSELTGEQEDMYNFKNSYYYNCEDYDDDSCFTSEPDDEDRLSATVEDYIMNNIKILGDDLFKLLTDEIVKIDEDSASLIKDLFEEPVSMKFRRLNTNQIQKINEEYEEILDQMYEKQDESLEEITKIISLGMIRSVDRQQWKDRLAELVSCKEGVDEILTKINNIRPLLYSKDLGYYFK